MSDVIKEAQEKYFNKEFDVYEDHKSRDEAFISLLAYAKELEKPTQQLPGMTLEMAYQAIRERDALKEKIAKGLRRWELDTKDGDTARYFESEHFAKRAWSDYGGTIREVIILPANPELEQSVAEKPQ